MGCGWGVLLRHLQFKPHFEHLVVSAAERLEARIYIRESYREIFFGNLLDGYPQIPSDLYDVVVCEQVLEHLSNIGFAIATLERVLKPEGKLIIGVPVFIPPLHLLRKHIVPHACRLTGGLPPACASTGIFSLFLLAADKAVFKPKWKIIAGGGRSTPHQRAGPGDV